MKHTALYPEHIKLKGKIVEFAGWELPVQYSSIVEEHLTVRNKAGLFDVSHLGRLVIKGEDSKSFIQYLTTNDLETLSDWNIQYSLVCNDEGGIMDDILVYKFPDSYLLVVNASNTDKIINIIQENKGNYQFNLDNLTEKTTMIAVQGPDAIQIVETHYSKNLDHLKKYQFTQINQYIVSRTGYTGEDGFEIISPNSDSIQVWNRLLEIGKPMGLQPCGLGARDTLRLETGNCLYGHEMDESIHAYEAGLGFVVKLDKNDFIGKQALLKIKDKPLKKKLIGLEMCNNSIPRNDYIIQKNNQNIGKVTSGTFSPVLKKGIAMGYVPIEYASIGTELDILIRDKVHPAKVVKKKWR